MRVESALADSLELGQEFLDTRTLEVRNQMRDTVSEISLLEEEGDQLRRALLARVRAVSRRASGSRG